MENIGSDLNPQGFPHPINWKLNLQPFFVLLRQCLTGKEES
jgi:hypothetical protein